MSGFAPTGSTTSMVGYGAAYAVASLSCTIGPFLAILATSTRSGGIVEGLAVVATYALGMGLVVGVLAVAIAVAQQAVVDRTRRLLPWVNRASGLLLVVAGAYVAYYGWYELRVLGGGDASDPVVDMAREVQGSAARLVTDAGGGTIAVVLGCLVAVGAVTALTRRQRSRRCFPPGGGLRSGTWPRSAARRTGSTPGSRGRTCGRRSTSAPDGCAAPICSRTPTAAAGGSARRPPRSVGPTTTAC